jgi:hypothetical protein
MTEPTLAACRREIKRLHDFFVSYYTGETDDSSPFIDALAPDFEMVGPDGDVLGRGAVVSLVEGKARAYGPGTFAIDIRNVVLVESGDGYALVRYEEHQRTPDDDTARLSSAFLRSDAGAPGGLAWKTVHETWLSGGQ